jgi:hypothetical protein
LRIADQVNQVAAIDVDVEDGKTVAELFVDILFDDKLDGIHFNLLVERKGMLAWAEIILSPGFFYFFCTLNNWEIGEWIYVIVSSIIPGLLDCPPVSKLLLTCKVCIPICFAKPGR